MKKQMLIMIVLVGCQSDGQENEPMGADPFRLPEIVTDEGILVFIESGELKADAESIDTWWIETRQCTQLSAEPPFIHIVNDLGEACELASDDLVGGHCNNGNGWFVAIESDYSDKRWLYKHEFIHYIRNQNGDDSHKSHDPNDSMWQCQWN